MLEIQKARVKMAYKSKLLERKSYKLEHGYRIVTRLKETTYSSGKYCKTFYVDLYNGRENVISEWKVLGKKE